MTHKERQRLRQEAAMWFARMMRPDATQHRDAFEAWLDADEMHGEAYRRIERRYQASGIVAQSGSKSAGIAPSWRRWIAPTGWGLVGVGGGLAAAAVMLLALSSAITVLLGPDAAHRVGPRPAALPASVEDASSYRVDTHVGEIRTIKLADGSKVTLDSAARLFVAFDGHERRISLARGRARFEVAHDVRPFVVTAGNGAITARGTVFDVDLNAPGRVEVVLLRGAIDVNVRDGARALPVRRLRPNEKTAFGPTGFVAEPWPISRVVADWPDGLLDVDALPLPILLREANRYATVPIVIGAPELESLKVSGRFRVDRPDLLTQNLADLFDLAVDRSRANRISLRKKI
ncbi:FecR family protein [Sphingobium sp. YR768]|nr:FecR family protein [Sphingobium sp. YR768]